MSYNIDGYIAICAEAERLGYPTVYRDDLRVHGLHALMDEDAPEVFYWGIRSTGTDIFFPKKSGYLELAYACQKHRTNEFYYCWTGSELIPISIEAIIEKMIQEAVNAHQ